MIGVGNRLAVLLQLQPADASVVVLHKLAVDFRTLLVGQNEIVAMLNRLGHQVVVITFLAMRASSVGATFHFQLHQPHVDPHLQQLSTIAATADAHADRVGIVRPIPQDVVDVIGSCHTRSLKRGAFSCWFVKRSRRQLHVAYERLTGLLNEKHQ